MPRLTFLHTGEAHVPVFTALLAEIGPEVEARHVVRADLLNEAIRQGGLTPPIRRATCEALLAAADEQPDAVLCTCSTIGPGADVAAELTVTPVLRVDRPMAERAVATGPRILVAACLHTTLGPTAGLVREAAARAGRAIELGELLMDDAWRLFEAGDRAGYVRRVAEGLRANAAGVDAIVLAQASMAGAAELCSDLGVPILSSPRSGVEAAVAVARAAADGCGG